MVKKRELDKALADHLSAASKTIMEEVRWRPDGRGALSLEAQVLVAEIEDVLRLSCRIGKTNIGFTLLYQNMPIRRYNNRGRHTGPDGVRVDGPHKHTWDAQYEDRMVYIPNDIDANADLNDQFLQFLEEENIELKGAYQRFMTGTI